MNNALTPQERNIAALVAEGKTNSEIGASLFIANGTVRNYVSVILQKLYLPNRAALAAYVVTHDMRPATPPCDPDVYKDLLFGAYV